LVKTCAPGTSKEIEQKKIVRDKDRAKERMNYHSIPIDTFINIFLFFTIMIILVIYFYYMVM